MTKGYKICFDETKEKCVLVELEISEGVEWLRPEYEIGDKCRAASAKVTKIHGGGKVAYSIYKKCWYNLDFKYVVGEEVHTDEPFDKQDIACSSGIHFFLDKQSALDYAGPAIVDED